MATKWPASHGISKMPMAKKETFMSLDDIRVGTFMVHIVILGFVLTFYESDLRLDFRPRTLLVTLQSTILPAHTPI